MQTRDDGVPLAFPAQVWAQLLDLGNPETAGARRIHQAQAWLEKNGFIAVEAQPGYANRVTVLNESGSREPYVTPGKAANALRDTPKKADHLYLQIPAEFWTSGYLASLTGTGIAMFLVLLAHADVRKPIEDLGPVWISPSELKDRYNLSDDTRSKGIRDLRDHGLVTVRRQAINPEDFDLERIRNVYTFQAKVLSQPAKRHGAEHTF